jgi:multicomponent Na+:H+ antiporter subunit F
MQEFGAQFLDLSILFAYGAMIVSFALTVFRLLRGPTPADRVVALDMLALLGIGFIGVFSISTGEYAFLDVAIALALVGFLATVAFARYVYRGALDERHKHPTAEKGDDA